MLFEPEERTSLASFTATRHFVLVTELDNVRSRIYVLDHRDGRWLREPLPGVPEFGDVSVQAIDPDLSDDYFLQVTDFLTPNTLAMERSDRAPPRSSNSFHRSSTRQSLTVSQHEAVSQDGTRIPTSRSPARISSGTAGTRPCFTATEDSRSRCCRRTDRPSGPPGSRRAESTSWPTSVAAVSSAPGWHQSALKANRYRAYDDFISVGEDLVRAR